MTEIELIDVYRKLFTKFTGRDPKAPSKSIPKSISEAKYVLEWCDERSVDPVQLMQLRISKSWSKYKRVPRFGKSLCVEWLQHAAQREERQAAIAKPDATFVQHVKSFKLDAIQTGAERLRAKFRVQGTQEINCLGNLLTDGYDPRSPNCLSCPVSTRCAQALNARAGFDVAALRDERWHLLPPRVVAALRGWKGGGV